jgi:molybdenum cofactor synthesis domain-containing protein
MEHLSVTDAQKCILESVNKLGIETVALEQSLGRVLADEVCANRDIPPYDVSAMDGYAVRSEDLTQGPVKLAVIEDIKAGDMPGKTVKAGQCSRIMTGAPLPKGADAVIRVEDTLAMSDNNVQFNAAVKPGNDIRRRGEGMRNSEVVLNAGIEITPGVTGVLATVKSAHVQVYRRPRVAILSTGNELEDIDDPVDPNKIPNSNSYALMAQVQALGIEPDLLGIARDDPAELEEYLQRGLRFDVLLVSGGTSVGVHDYVRPVIESLGVQMKFWRVAMKPGHPASFGLFQRHKSNTSKVVEADEVQGARRAATRAYLADRQGSERQATQRAEGWLRSSREPTGLPLAGKFAVADTFVFGLPGNPVSSMVCFEEFVAPALRRMMGHSSIYRSTVQARLTHDVKHQPGRTEFVRVILGKEQGSYIATSTGAQGSGMLLSMARADGLMVVPADSKGISAGEQVFVQLLDGTLFQDDAGFCI